MAQYRDAGSVTSFWDQLRRRVEALPGVTGVTFSDGRFPDGIANFNNFELEDAPSPPGKPQPVVPWVSVTPDYFKLLGLSLLEGRMLDEQDTIAPDVVSVVVDRAWAKRFFPDGRVIGRRMIEGGCSTCPRTTVVGVVSNVKYLGLDKPDEGTVYQALGPTARFRFLIVRTNGKPLTIVASVRHVVRDIDPNLPFSRVATFDELVGRYLERRRSVSVLVATVASVALLLSVIGVYGVMANYVQQHTKEIGIRLALGGSRGDLFRRVVGQGMIVVAAGVLVGVLAAFAATRAMASLLFGVGAADPQTFVVVVALLTGVALVACAFPAGRAIRMEPASVLRED
jgi:predicted permease